MVTAVRLGALALGVSCAGLGAYGAFEFAHRLEGEVTYLVLAAPLIAVTAALIPPIAEATWRAGTLSQGPSLVGHLGPGWSRGVLLRCRAGPRSRRPVLRPSATHFAVLRLVPRQHSPRAKRAWPRREPRPTQRGLRSSAVLSAGPSSQLKRRRKLTWKLRGGSCSSPRSTATTDSPLQAPVWLLPAALDLVAFMAIWTGLSTGPVKGRRREPARRRIHG